MSKFVINIKQHTPLIHFQHNQKGATIRATELKPKLDRYLIKYCFKDDFEQYKKFLIGYKEHKKGFADIKALNYKVKIYAKDSKILNIEDGKKQFPLFFGNLNVEEYKKKKFVYSENINIEFFSFEKELIDKIVEIFPKFLMHNNFGMRQSKGFGSFFINDEGVYYLDCEQKNYTDKQIQDAKDLKYKFIVKKNMNLNNIDPYKEYKYLFSKIEKFYKSLRSGLYNSDKKLTIDPYIKIYADSKQIKWEKDVIKQKIYSNKNNINNYKKELLMKDIFGLSIVENWKQQDWKITKEDCISKEEEKITRFKSPIFFKPLKNENGNFDVYFEAIKIDERFLNREFLIKCNEKISFNLKTPEKFDFEEFFNFVLNQKENDNLPNDVIEIYKQIKDNLKKR